MSRKVTGRLLGVPLPNQIRSIQRTRIVEPDRLCAWFEHWEKKPDDFKPLFEELTEDNKTEFRSLQNVYEAVVERPFNLSDTGNGVEVTPMRQAFQIMKELVVCVAKKHSNGLVICGPGGVGKSFTVLEAVDEAGLEEGVDYLRIPGYATPVGLYNTLFENKEKLIIFDDCDSIFKDMTGLNILKSVLDTLPRRQVSWKTSSNKVLVEDFVFNGQIIFISNMNPDKVKDVNFRALLTRVMTLLVSGSRTEILMRMVELLPVIGRDLTSEQQEELLQFLKENHQKFKDFSLRFLVNLVSLRKYSVDRWRDLALALR